MLDYNQISILGSDKRMEYVAQYLFDKGFEINRRCEDISNSDIVIVAPNTSLDFEKLIECMKSNSKLFLSQTNILLEKLCIKKGVKSYNYFGNETITRENAKLTAYGIIREAKTHNVMLEESNCLVSGFGFCGKEIIKELLNYNARVDVFVRNKEQKHEIEQFGCQCLLMQNYEQLSFEKYSYIFNTVPALVFTSNILNKVAKNAIIFDIASLPGGVDDVFCKTNHIEVIHSLGIPGKMYPKESGILIAKEIFEILYNASDPCES